MLADPDIMSPSYLSFLQLHVGDVGNCLVVVAAKGFVEVMKQVSSGRDDDVNKMVFYQVSEQSPHPRGNQLTVQAHKDGSVIRQHVDPEVMRIGERASLE